MPVYSGDRFPIWEVIFLMGTLLMNYSLARAITRVITDCRGGKQGEAIWVSIVAALGSLLCFGIAGTAVIQAAVAREARKYGIKPRLFGIAREDFAAKIAELSAVEGIGPSSSQR
ncbi:MAG: hypothetical protein K1X67_06110 [Fimbriimonadaceae bacterium]|nr:hypothetical protein [Fimbriimonadaceae bacterium]